MRSLRKRRYHTGGGIPPHPHPHTGIYADVPEDLDVLGSLVQDPLVSESTQPYGHTSSLDPFAQQITLLPEKLTFEEELEQANKRRAKIFELSLLEWINNPSGTTERGEATPMSPELLKLIEEEEAFLKEHQDRQGTITQYKPHRTRVSPDLRWMFPQGMQGASAEQQRMRDQYVAENPLSNPVSILGIGATALAGLPAASSIIIPGTSHIAGGVAVGDVMNAYFLKEGIEVFAEHVPEFIDDPSWGGAGNLALDAIMVYPGMKGLKTNVLDPFTKAYKEAKIAGDAAAMQNAMDDLGYNYYEWSAKQGDWVKPKGFTSSPSQQITSQLTSELPAVSGEAGALQQLTSELSTSSAAASAAAPEGGLFGGKFTFKGLKDFFIPKQDLTVPSGQLSLKGQHSALMTDAMKEGEKFVSQYYLNANTLDRLGSLYGPIGANQLFNLKTNKRFDQIGSNLADKNFTYTPPDQVIYPGNPYVTYQGITLAGRIKELYTQRALWSAQGAITKGHEYFPFELSKDGGNWGTYTNKHFPGILTSEVGGFGRSNPFSGGIEFTPKEILRIYSEKPFGIHPNEFKRSLIDTYGDKKGLSIYNKVGGMQYNVKNPASGIKRVYGVKSDVNKFIDEKGHKSDPSRKWSTMMQQEYYKVISTVVHEMNHYYFGQVNLPNELITPWMQYLTDEANFHLFARYPDTDKIGFGIEYHSQPVEIQARTGELRYQLVDQILKNKGINLTANTPSSQINEAVTELEVILKRGDEDAFNKLFGGKNGAVVNSINTNFMDIIKGDNFNQKRKAFMELMKIVPVVGAPLVLSAGLSEEEDLPILGYAKGGILQSMAKKNRSDKNKFVSSKVKVLRKKGKSLKQAVAMALDMWKRKKKKKEYAEGGAVEGWGIQTNFSQDPNALQPTDVEEPEKPQEELEALIPDPPPTYEEETFGSSEFNVEHQRLGIEENVEQAGMGGYDEAIMASEYDQFVNKAIEETPIFGGWAKAGKFVGETGTNLIVGDSTGQQRKNRQIISAAIFSPHKLLAMREAEKSGDFHYIEEEEQIEEVIPHKYTDFWSAEKAEEGFAAKGVKIKKRKKKYDEGGLLEALRQRRAQRRLDRTTIQPYNPEFLGKDTAGRFNQYLQEVQGVPRRSLVLDPDADDSVLTHELIHSTQYGPLQQIAAELDFKGAGRIQDKDSRKAFKKLFKSIDPKTQTFNSIGEFMIGGKEQDIEFDAIIKSAISSAKKRGYDLSGKTYGEILDTLSKARDEGNISLNMRHLGNFMNRDKKTGNTWTDEQKGYIMDAIKANLDFEGYTAEDIKQDLR